jgi:anti-sigma factor ChrR (cupin superfamily)
LLNKCPEPELIAVYLYGNASAGERYSIEQHLVACRKCRKLLADIVKTERVLNDNSSDHTTPS